MKLRPCCLDLLRMGTAWARCLRHYRTTPRHLLIETERALLRAVSKCERHLTEEV